MVAHGGERPRVFSMVNISPSKTGLALGSTLAVVHLLWSATVALGLGQWFIDWIFKLHFIQPPYSVAAFDWTLAVGLIIVTFVVGHVLGWLFGWLWNQVTTR
jgi:hypothetical protein